VNRPELTWSPESANIERISGG